MPSREPSCFSREPNAVADLIVLRDLQTIASKHTISGGGILPCCVRSLVAGRR